MSGNQGKHMRWAEKYQNLTVDREKKFNLLIYPSSRFLSVTEGCIYGGEQEREWNHRVWNPQGNTVVGIFKTGSVLETCTEPTPSTTPFFRDMLHCLVWSLWWRIHTVAGLWAQTTSKLWQIYLKTKDQGLYLNSTPLIIYRGTWKLRKPSTLRHHKKLCETLSKHVQG